MIEIPGRQDKKGFFPETIFTELIYEQRVREELKQFPQWFDSATVEAITASVCGDKPLRKIFCLLLIMDKLVDIKLFIDDGVFDECLPLMRLSRPHSGNTLRAGPSSSSERPIQQLRCFDNWNKIDIWTFQEWQWTTLSPILKQGKRRNVKHLILHDEQSLPFTTDSRQSSVSEVIEGGFSTVFKVHIHPANHRFQSPIVSFQVRQSHNSADNYCRTFMITTSRLNAYLQK